MPKKRWTILVVDGDRRDREIMRRMLAEAGYSVVEASDFWEAIDMHRQHQGQIDLLLTALALPGDNGYELARTLFRKDATLRALFVSGPTGAEVSPYYHMPMTGTHLLTKPVRPDDVLDRVRSVFRTKVRRADTRRAF